MAARRAARLAVAAVLLAAPPAVAVQDAGGLLPSPVGLTPTEPLLDLMPEHVDHLVEQATEPEELLGLVNTPLASETILADLLPRHPPPAPEVGLPVVGGPGIPRLDPFLAPPPALLDALAGVDRAVEPHLAPVAPVLDAHTPPSWEPPTVVDWAFARGRAEAAAAGARLSAVPAVGPGPAASARGAPALPGEVDAGRTAAAAGEETLATVQAVWDGAKGPMVQMYAPEPLGAAADLAPPLPALSVAAGARAALLEEPAALATAAALAPGLAAGDATPTGAAVRHARPLVPATAGAQPSPAPGQDLLLAVGVAAMLLFLKPLAALYHRLAPAALLEQPTRRRIHDTIAAQPGIRVGTLQAALGLNYNTVLRHVRTLERHGFVQSQGPGQRRWFASSGALGPEQRAAAVATSAPTVRQVLAYVKARGAADLPTLRRDLGLPRSTASDAVARLAQAGLVVVERRGPVVQVARAGGSGH